MPKCENIRNFEIKALIAPVLAVKLNIPKGNTSGSRIKTLGHPNACSQMGALLGMLPTCSRAVG